MADEAPRCPVQVADLGKLGTASARQADQRDKAYAQWHAKHGQQLKRKYRAGKRGKSVR